MTIQNPTEFVEKNAATSCSTLAMAVALAKQGIPVFPVHSNKVPACTHGFKDAAKEIKSATSLFLQYPAPLVGVVTGKPSGFDALDIDPRNGGNKWLDEHAAKIPATRIHRTRSGGWHYLFQHHAGLRNSAGRIAAGVDIRADGGSLIWWPSAGFPVLNDALIAPWPDWLLALALPPPHPAIYSTVIDLHDVGDAYIRAALRRGVDAVMNAAEGTRNAVLNQQAWSLMRFAQSGGIGAQEIAASLYTAACAAGLSHHEIVSTLASAIRARGLA
ncbi:MAG: bifunctional DNA primase/polymerase [Alphaproteobacteria bacterium]